MKNQESIVVSQHFSHRYNQNEKVDPETNPEHVFKVEKMVNTLVVSIGQYLTPARVQGLIDGGVNVTIQPVK